MPTGTTDITGVEETGPDETGPDETGPDETGPDETGPELSTVEIWSDGACKGNPGVGGWGAWMRSGGHERELFGGDQVTTNNRMELTAVIESLRALNRRCAVRLHVDSTYVMKGLNDWLPGWKRNGWRTSAKKPVKNVDLWQALDVEVARHAITWIWVKGHSGDEGNEHADQLANRGVDEVRARGEDVGVVSTIVS